MVVDDFHRMSFFNFLYIVVFFALTYYLVLILCGKVFSFISIYELGETLSCMYSYVIHCESLLYA